MALVTLGDLRTAALRGRADLVGEFTNILALAEQRIYFGGDGVPPLRIRQMEGTADVAFTSGVGALPASYLDKRSLYWSGAAGYLAVPYESPAMFYEAEAGRRGGSYPLGYTIEGSSVKILPALTGTGKLLHYAKAAAMTLDNDTNVIMQNFPGVYLFGCQAERFRLTRDPEQAIALKRYADAVTAANQYTLQSRSFGGPVRRRVGMGV